MVVRWLGLKDAFLCFLGHVDLGSYPVNMEV